MRPLVSQTRVAKNPHMDELALKTDLLRYLHLARESLLWKVEGLSEYDVRRPTVRTGTNLLGLVKHAAIVEAWYFGEAFGRPFGEPLPWWDDDAAPNADMCAIVDETRADVLAFYQRAARHADATVNALDLDTVGHVPWWSRDGEVTLHRMMVHVVAETHRHAGHADIIRELIDGAAGLRDGNSNLPDLADDSWLAHRDNLEQVARLAQQRADGN